jgi:CheY-like chemotaxis protein
MAQDNNKKKILVVEDEPIICRICARILTTHDYSVDMAENGLVARNMIENAHYDICLTDVRIPVMGGIELYKFLEESYPLLAEKTVFMTGDSVSNDIKQFLETTGTKCILKPFTPDELNAVIGQLAR